MRIDRAMEAAGESASVDMVKLHLAERGSHLQVTPSYHKACVTNDPTQRSNLDPSVLQPLVLSNIVTFRRRILLRFNHTKYSIKVFKFFYWILLLSYGVVAKKVLS